MLQKINKLIENKQYQTLREEISEMNAADLAALFEELSGEEIVKIYGCRNFFLSSNRRRTGCH